MNYFGFHTSSKAASGVRRSRALRTFVLLGSVWALPATAESLDTACAAYRKTAADATTATGEIPYGEGVLWRVGNGSGDPNYLFGTLHSQDRRVSGLEPPVRLALAQSDRLLIEVVPDAEANRTYLESIYAGAEPGLKARLPAPLYERLQALSADYGLSPERLNELAPWAAFSQIGRPRPVRAPTLDQVIYQTAHTAGKPVIGLETMAELVRTLASLPIEDQLTILEDTLCNHAQILRDSRTLVDLYLERDLAGMVALNEQPHHDEAVFDRFMEAVLYRRNDRMLERMLPYLEQGGSFVAVGALHLPGERGLLKRLEQEGYTLTRVY